MKQWHNIYIEHIRSLPDIPKSLRQKVINHIYGQILYELHEYGLFELGLEKGLEHRKTWFTVKEYFEQYVEDSEIIEAEYIFREVSVEYRFQQQRRKRAAISF